MKLFNAKKIAFLFAALCVLALFSSCQDVIYANIRKEVSLEDANITGDIRSVVRFKDEFYLANGGIYHKSNTANYYGAWSKGEVPPDGLVLKLAADNDYLYALVGVHEADETKGENVGVSQKLYYSSDGSSWSLVSGVYGSGTIPYNSSSVIRTYLFCTNAIAISNRKAYFILQGGDAGYKAYMLDGPNTSSSSLELGTENAATDPISNSTSVSQSCVFYNSAVYFFTSRGSCTNETTAASATIYYYGDGSTLRWGGDETGSVDAKSTVYSIAATSNYLLVGTSSGISHHPLSSWVPSSRQNSFSTNADSTLSSQYTVLSLLAVNPESTETGGAIYATQNFSGSGSNSAQFDHIGLWAYYPSRGNWNRE